MKDETFLTTEQQQNIEERLSNAAKDGRVLCSGALAIAKSLKISPEEVGRIATRLDIKISKCQLGCF